MSATSAVVGPVLVRACTLDAGITVVVVIGVVVLLVEGATYDPPEHVPLTHGAGAEPDAPSAESVACRAACVHGPYTPSTPIVGVPPLALYQD